MMKNPANERGFLAAYLSSVIQRDDGCRKAAPPSEWLYQLPDDAAELEAMLARLKKPASFMDKLSGRYVGVFETYRWSGSEIINRC
jgi:hypothetical protein